MNSKQVCQEKREVFQVNIRRKIRNNYFVNFRDQLLKQTFGFNPHTQATLQIPSILNLIIEYIEGKNHDINDILKQFIKAIDKQQPNKTTLTQQIVGIFKQLYQIVQKQLPLKSQQYKLKILAIIALFPQLKIIQQESISYYQLVPFITSILNIQNLKLLKISLVFINNYANILNGKNHFLEQNTFILKISSITKQCLNIADEDQKISIVKYLLSWWEGIKLSELDKLEQIDGETILSIYKITLEVINNYDDYLQDQNQITIVLALRTLYGIMNSFLDEIMDITNETEIELHPNQLVNLLNKQHIYEGKQTILELMYLLITKSKDFCMVTVEQTNYALTIVEMMTPKLQHKILETIFNIIHVGGSSDHLIEPLHNLCVIFGNQEIAYEERKLFLGLMAIWFFYNNFKKDSLEHPDIKFLELLSTSQQIINEQVQQRIWRAALRRGYNGKLPKYLNIQLYQH